MGDCEICDGDQNIPFTCDRCGGTYCSEHRLPEAHNCVSATTTDYGENWFNSTQDSSAQPSTTLRTKVVDILFMPVIFVWGFARAARRNWLLGIILLGLIGGGALAATGNLQATIDGGTDFASSVAGGDELNETQIEKLVHEKINDVRENRSLNRLRMDPELRVIARGHSQDMANRSYFSHNSPEGDTFEDRYLDAGYSCRVSTGGNTYVTGGENILYTFEDADIRTDNGVEHYDGEEELANAIVRQWMNSPDHRENILKTYWQNEGIGIATVDNHDGAGIKVYATQNFC